ncbi:MAG: hypothetical protein RR035_07710 [Oscillibacter sp.]
MFTIKTMLLGITIILLTILIHLFIEDGLITDFIAVFGLLFVLVGYFLNDKKD